MKNDKFLQRIRSKRQNVRFNDFVGLIKAMGFEKDRQVGSHQIFFHKCGAVLNVQNKHGEAKPYQIRQFLDKVDLYGLQL